MADNSSDNMVLRTVYLPRELDQQLKSAAFRNERSKNDVIRELIQVGLQSLQAKHDHRFDKQAIKSGGRPVSVKRAVRRVATKAK